VLFRLDYDQQSGRKTDEEEIYKLLETSVPGLVLQRERTKADASILAGKMDSAVTGHKLLIAPDPFNIVYLLPPTISFLDRVKELIPYLPSRFALKADWVLEVRWLHRLLLRSWMTF